MCYLIIVEETSTVYSIYSPYIPGCVPTGVMQEEEEVTETVQKTLAFHIEGMQLEGLKIPVPPSTRSSYVNIAASPYNHAKS